MKKNILFKQITLAFVLGLLFFPEAEVSGQNDINFLNVSNRTIDLDNLQLYFDNVIGRTSVGSPITYNGSNAISFSINDDRLPTSAAEYAGIDMIVMGQAPFGWFTQDRLDLVVDFVKGGGILILNSEDEKIFSPSNGIRPSYYGQWFANEFLCVENGYLIHQTPAGEADPEAGSTRCDVPSRYHPGDGILNITPANFDQNIIGNLGVGRSLVTSGSAWYVGVPPENAILYCNPNDGVSGSTGGNATCGNQAVLEMVFPAKPGEDTDCLQGMALISGEFNGILADSDRAFMQYNNDIASLLFDFLHDPAAMAIRNDWDANPVNVNATCPPGALDPAGGPVGAGTIDCGKTQIATAPVVGEAGQKSLIVTMNVTTAGCFPVTVSGSGMTLAMGYTEVCTSNTGTQTFSIPVDYDGTALGSMMFEVGTGNSCIADLTNTPRQAITPIYTLECVPTVGPTLR